MTDYIKREDAIEEACKGCNDEFSEEPCEPSECCIRKRLSDIPSADVVEVVRCKNCKYWIRDEKDPDEYYGWCENSHWTYCPKSIETADGSIGVFSQEVFAWQKRADEIGKDFQKALQDIFEIKEKIND